MPVKVIKYTCQYKCRHKAISSVKAMENHENKCWFNPTNKTCKTCVNEEYGFEDSTHDYPGIGWYRNCKCEGGTLLIDKWWEKKQAEYQTQFDYDKLMIDALKLHKELDDPSNHRIPPIVNCPFWKTKETKEEK